MQQLQSYLVTLLTYFLIFTLSSVYSKCGLSFSYKQRLSVFEKGKPLQIYGGQQAFPGDFPWQVSMQRKKYNWWLKSYRFEHQCGAFIIDENWLLTAAHCFTEASPRIRTDEELKVVFGTLHWEQKDVENQLFTLSDVIVHKDFSKPSFRNDIALVKLRRPIKFTDDVGDVNGRRTAIGSICLSREKDIHVGMATVAGWGQSETKRVEPILRYVHVEVLNASDCSAYTKKGQYDAVMPSGEDTKICAGYNIGIKDSCHGDSGGPLFSKIGDQAIAFGIVSTGYLCALPRHPGVYTRISLFRRWIEEKTQLKFTFH